MGSWVDPRAEEQFDGETAILLVVFRGDDVWTADSGQRTGDSGQGTADRGQRTADSGQRVN